MKKKGVILLSGGIDSATAAAIAINQGFDLSAITFFYSQRHDIEIKCSEKLVEFLKIKDHIKISLPADIFKSALISESKLNIPKNRNIKNIKEDIIPETYVPARNIIFLSYALAYGESIGAKDIFIGATEVDYSGYPDCRAEFFSAFKKMADIGTKTGAEGGEFIIHTPLLHLHKHEIISLGTELGVDYSLTHSCYDPSIEGYSCGKCDSCLIRMKGFVDAGIPDPTIYKRKI
ncbi:MAG: 7-cyano-7-deazaguanine synthase QueC [Leptospirales bacterium]|nr:7-cyano-7-deazaguanine synthase QueC [Leptospirales bacterium]